MSTGYCNIDRKGNGWAAARQDGTPRVISWGRSTGFVKMVYAASMGLELTRSCSTQNLPEMLMRSANCTISRPWRLGASLVDHESGGQLNAWNHCDQSGAIVSRRSFKFALFAPSRNAKEIHLQIVAKPQSAGLGAVCTKSCGSRFPWGKGWAFLALRENLRRSFFAQVIEKYSNIHIPHKRCYAAQRIGSRCVSHSDLEVEMIEDG